MKVRKWSLKGEEEREKICKGSRHKCEKCEKKITSLWKLNKYLKENESDAMGTADAKMKWQN